MDNEVYWIWLQLALGFGNFKVGRLVSFWNCIEEFYELGEPYWKCLHIFSEKELEKLKTIGLSESREIFEKNLDSGCSVLSFSSGDYPELLRKIPNPPCVLYVKGDISCLSFGFSLAIVGSRKATFYGTGMAFEIAHDLAKFGALIVSGGAIGADTAAHKGAIKAQGRTVAVMACGIDYPYLLQNTALRYEISQNGALVSEYPIGYPVQNFNFPIRNRLISALSQGVIVVEAGEKSGAILTASFAAEQNRDVFVVPVPSENPLSRGIMPLISDGATVITCAEDVLNEYGLEGKNKLDSSFKNFKEKIIFSYYNNTGEGNSKKTKNIQDITEKQNNKNTEINPKTFEKKIDYKKLTENEMAILKIIKDKKIHIDEIKNKTKFSMQQIFSLLTKLEVLGIIESFPGKFYFLK